MADTNNESGQDDQNNADALDGLPEKERKETTDILAELENGGKTPEEIAADKEKEGKDGEPIPPKPADAEAEAAKSEAEKQAELDKDKEPARRPPAEEPVWMRKIAERRADKAEKTAEELRTELETVQAESKKALEQGGKPADVADDLDKKLADISAESGIEVPVLKKLVGVLDASRPAASVVIPPELTEALSHVATLEKQRATEVETAKFSSDFDQFILPLVKKEYGQDVPPETVNKIKQELATIAYSKEFAAVPYTTIYKGTDGFRGIIPPKVKGAEQGRGGTTAMEQDAARGRTGNSAVDWERLSKDDTYAVDDDDLKKLSDADVDKYMDIVGKRGQPRRG